MADDKPDSVLDDVRAAAAELERADASDAGKGPVDAPAEAPVAGADQTQQTAAERARDEQGRFAKTPEGQKPRETLTLKPQEKPADQQAQPKPAEQAQLAPATGQTITTAPLHWKGSAKVDWNKLPENVKLGILEDHKALSEQQASLEPLTKAIDPHREVWMRDAGSIEAAIGQLGQFYRLYLDNPQGLIQHIARTRGIDLGQPQGQPQPGTQQQAPDINSVVSQAVQQAIRPFQEQMQQTESQQLQQSIQTFAQDPAHPYFQDVKVHMGHLLKAGQAKDMQDAYDQATWANPVIRQSLIDAQAAERTKQMQADADRARKAAAASVRGSPLPGVNGSANPTASAHDDARAAYAEVMGS